MRRLPIPTALAHVQRSNLDLAILPCATAEGGHVMVDNALQVTIAEGTQEELEHARGWSDYDWRDYDEDVQYCDDLCDLLD